MMKPWTLLMLCVMAPLSAAVADKCPNLVGVYDCPARADRPAFRMTVEQFGGVRGVVRFNWAYSDLIDPVSYLGSTRGVVNPDGFFGVCRNEGFYLTRNMRDLAESLRNAVNLSGDYVVTTFMNEPVLTCTRVRPFR